MLMTILECSLSMSVLILLLLALTPWLSRRYAAKWLYCAWLVIVVGLIIPFRFHPTVPLIQVPVVFSSLQKTIAEIPENLASLPVTAGTPVYHHMSALNMSQFLFLLWVAGSVFFLLRTIWKHHCFLRTVQRWGKEVQDPEILNLFSRIKAEMGIREDVRLLTCPRITSPMMTGFFHPVILLPEEELPPQECALVLQHELVHRKRRDLWCKYLALLATTLHWFNPLVYLVAREVDTWCEISCDAEVVKGKNLEERQCYSVTILQAAGWRSSFPTVLSTRFTGGKRALRNRLQFVLEDTARKRTGILLLCLVLLGTLGTGMMTTHIAAAASDPWGKGEILNYIFFPDREMGLDPKEVQNYYAWKLATTGTTDEALLQKDLNLTDQQMTQLRQLGAEECSQIQHLTLPSDWTSSSVSASINAAFATIDNTTRTVLGSQYDAFRQWVQNWEQREEQYQKQWFEEQVRLINSEGGPGGQEGRQPVPPRLPEERTNYDRRERSIEEMRRSDPNPTDTPTTDMTQGATLDSVPESGILGVPLRQQEYVYYCGPASAQELLDYEWGYTGNCSKYSQHTLATYIQTDPVNGTYASMRCPLPGHKDAWGELYGLVGYDDSGSGESSSLTHDAAGSIPGWIIW